MSDIEKVGYNVAVNANRTTRRGEGRGSNYAFLGFRESGIKYQGIQDKNLGLSRALFLHTTALRRNPELTRQRQL